MEFHEQLQTLRKQKGMTQEELAKALFVSRTAVSKWESNRGVPSIDSLKAIATFFGVTIDQLLSGDELLSIAQEDAKTQRHHVRDLVFGLLDVSVVSFLFLPLFGQTVNGALQAVSLLSLNASAPWIRGVYLATVVAIAVWGLLTLVLQTCRRRAWTCCKSAVSVALNAVGALMFILGSQPYAATLLFVYLIIKAFLLFKKP